MPKTKLGLLNFLFLQWFFIRLARVRYPFDWPDGWELLFGPAPLTGWWGAYFPHPKSMLLTRRPGKTTMRDPVFIYSTKIDCHGEECGYYRPEAKGYTADPLKAGLFEHDAGFEDGGYLVQKDARTVLRAVRDGAQDRADAASEALAALDMEDR